jgi:uncharacterized protein YwqG
MSSCARGDILVTRGKAITGVASSLTAIAGLFGWRGRIASSTTLAAADNQTESLAAGPARGVNRDEWRRKLIQDGIDESLAAQLADYVRPSIALVPQSATASTQSAVGRSRLGGRPDLPRGMKWPLRQPYNLVYPRGNRSAMHEERPLAFLAQINLADIASGGGTNLSLPSSGLLSFFYDAESQPWGFDPGDSAGFLLMWFEDQVLEPQEPPQTLHPFFKPVLLAAQPRECIPPTSSFAMAQLFERLPNPKSARDQLETLFSKEQTKERYWTSRHAFGGWACPIQGEMETECQLVTNGIFCGSPEGYESRKAARLRSGAADWRLVLQLASDQRAGFEWGDGGTVYVWMREQDVRACRFDQCWTILQCY